MIFKYALAEQATLEVANEILLDPEALWLGGSESITSEIIYQE